MNPARTGTKAAARYARTVGAGETITLELRLACAARRASLEAPFAGFDAVFEKRREEADEFYAAVLPPRLSSDARLVARQAFAGMLWSKQYYHYVVSDWLEGDPKQPPPPPGRRHGRNHDWTNLFARDVISMPDKWEFPWFAAWDLGFHCVTLAHVDPQFAKAQILLMLREWYMHPNGQIPAYEWDFGDVNPPVLSMAARRGVRHRAPPHGRRRLRVPRARLPEDAPELHMVGQPQGRDGEQHLPGRLPGDGQHRRLRSRQAAARLPAGAGRRHRAGWRHSPRTC